MPQEAVPALVERMRHGDRTALARLLSLVEGGGEVAVRVAETVHPHAGRAYVLGVTGPPGAGKSTLVSALISRYRAGGLTVGVLAVDPTSPLSGGAFLGDRVRMQRHYLDQGVFIRSMATRHGPGGLPGTAYLAVKVLDAAGFDLVVVETVGVGQGELEVMHLADTVVAVLVPESGDAVQTLKAGLLEVADILVVNKADREGAPRLAQALELMVRLAPEARGWRPPVVLTEATTGRGVERLTEEVHRHREAMASSSSLEARRRGRRRREFLRALESALSGLLEGVLAKGEVVALLEEVEAGRRDAHSAAAQLLEGGQLWRWVREWLADKQGG